MAVVGQDGGHQVTVGIFTWVFERVLLLDCTWITCMNGVSCAFVATGRVGRTPSASACFCFAPCGARTHDHEMSFDVTPSLKVPRSDRLS